MVWNQRNTLIDNDCLLDGKYYYITYIYIYIYTYIYIYIYIYKF